MALTPGATEASVLAAIDRLGDPAEIVASEDAAPTAAAGLVAPSRSAWGPLEIMAVLLLIVGAFLIPIIGPLAGLVCAWLSPAWTRGEKWIATALASGAIVVAGAFVVSMFGAF